MPSVTRNTLSLLIGSVAQKAIAFVYFALIARWAGVEDTGRYFFALSWTLMFSILTDVGLTSVLIRETARNPAGAGKMLNRTIAIKLPFMALAAVVVIAGVRLLGYPPVTVLMVSLAAVVLMLDAVSLTFYGILRGHHALKYESLGLFIGQTITIIVGVTVLRSGAPAYYLMFALIAGSLYNAIASVVIVRRRLGIRPAFDWDRSAAVTLLKTAFPFALAGAFVKIYTSVDVVLLSKLKGDIAAGLYSVPYKLTFAFQFIPMAFTAALYPAMSHYFVTDERRLGDVFYKALRYLSLIVLPIVAGIAALAAQLVHLVYGPSYLAMATAVQLLIPTLIFIFLDFPVGSLLNACDRQMTQTKLMGLATLTSVVINATLIPFFGVMGAVAASLVSHGVLFIGGLVVVNRFLTWPFRRFLFDFFRVSLAAAAMALVVITIKRFVPLPVAILTGAITYPALILLLRAMTPADLKDLAGMVFKRG